MAEVFNNILENVSDYLISMEEGLRMRENFRSKRERFRKRRTMALEYGE